MTLYQSKQKSNVPQPSVLEQLAKSGTNPVTMQMPPHGTSPGRFYEGGGHHTPPALHDEFMIDLSNPNGATPASNVTYRAAMAHAKQGCQVCQAFLSGLARGARGREEIARQMTAAKSAQAAKTAPTATAPRRTVQTAGATRLQTPSVTRSQPLTPAQRLVAEATRTTTIPPSSARTTVSLERAVRRAGDFAVRSLAQEAGEDGATFIARVAKVRGAAENAERERIERLG